MYQLSFPKKYTQEEIFQYFFPEEIVLGKKYRNPLRNDKTAGCCFYYPKSGNLQFVDGKEFYNCFRFAIEKEGLYDVASVFSFMAKNDKQISASVSILDNPKVLESIEILKKDFTKEELDFWGYSASILENYNVFSVKNVYYNKELAFVDCKMTFAFINYGYNNEKYIQLYFPLKEKTKRYRSVTVNIFPQIEKVNYKKDYIIISKGNKEPLRLQIQGYNAFGVINENYVLNSKIMNHLHNSFNYVILNFDNDVAGRRLSIKYQKEYPHIKFLFMFLPFKLGKDLTSLSQDSSNQFVQYYLNKHNISNENN